MPAMPRCDSKAQKIAERIIGTPPNMRDSNKKRINAKKTKTDDVLEFEETSQIR
jgi:ribosomal protein L27